MIATLLCDMPFDRSSRPISRLQIVVRPDDSKEWGATHLKLSEVKGSEDEVAKVLRELIK